jgi:tripartite-type tricarboxylate transporter receptor subunit TctC
MKILLKTFAGAAVLLAIASAPALAQTYPNKPIRMIVPFPAGGGTDFVGRLVAKYMGDKLGQTIVVENRGGANGGIGLQEVARATPDGYTIAFTSDSPLTVNQWLYKNMPYNAERDFIPVASVVRLPGMLAVHPSVPVKTIAELIALAKSKPGQLNYASAGVGNFSHLAMELFFQATGVKIQHVPYKGTGPASLALLGGEVQMGFNNVQTLIQNVQAGKLVALAVAEPKRMAQHPELPTVADTVPGFEMAPYVGIVAPAGTPKDIVDKLSKAAVAVMQDPVVAKQCYEQDLTVSALGPAEYAILLKNDAKKWEKVVKAAGIQME